MANPIKINDLRLFLDVVESGSYTKVAAQRLTAQSHVSRQIRALEQACGGTLFRRTGRGVVPTEFGLHVAQRVQAWMRESDAFFSDIRQMSTVPMGEVRVGVMPSAAHPLMTRVFQQLHTSHPRIRLNVREGQGSALDEMLDTGDVDLAVLFRYGIPDGSDETLLATAGTYLVSAPGDPLTAQPNLAFSQLSGLPLVLPRRPSHWRAILDETARNQGVTLDAALEADSLLLQKEAVATQPGLYALLGPYSIVDDLRSGRLQATRVISPDLRRYVTLAFARQGKLTQASRLVARHIIDTVDLWGSQLNP